VERTDDDAAVAMARDGDADAYEALVARYTAVAHRTAVLFGAGDEADDVVQEAFVKAYRALGGFRAGERFRPWLLQIVVNETRNLHRSRRRRSGLAGRLAVLAPDLPEIDPPDAAVIERERAAALLAALRSLPDRDRQVVTCRYLLDLSEAETAEVLGWPKGSVKSRLSRALGRLQTALASLGDREVVADG